MPAARSGLGKLTDLPAARNDVVRRIGRIEDSTQFVIRIGMLPFTERGQTSRHLNVGQHMGRAGC
jgi:hypothetical protein